MNLLPVGVFLQSPSLGAAGSLLLQGAMAQTFYWGCAEVVMLYAWSVLPVVRAFHQYGSLRRGGKLAAEHATAGKLPHGPQVYAPGIWARKLLWVGKTLLCGH